MSNRKLQERIAKALAAYRAGQLGVAALNDAVVQHGRALEGISSYSSARGAQLNR